MIRAFRQVFSVTVFGLKSIGRRRVAALTAAVGVAGVVGVFVAVLSIAEGVRAVMTVEGPDDRAIVVRKGANNEMSSGIDRETADLIADSPGVARTADGPLCSAELFVMVNLPKISSGTEANVPMRGIEPAGIPLRGDVQIVEGRMFERGKNELIVGSEAAQTFEGLTVGNTIALGHDRWKVVGIFKCGGGSSESELWTDAAVLQANYQREGYQSVHVRLTTPEAFDALRQSIDSNPRVQVDVMHYGEYMSASSDRLRTFIEEVGDSIAALMALGALFGAMNTMYSAVAARTREIATLRALGFGVFAVVFSVLLESVLVAATGGAFGATVAYLVFNGFHASTMNFGTFTQIAFAFRVTPTLMLQAAGITVLVGLLGGLLPAIRAARLPIAAALRAV